MLTTECKADRATHVTHLFFTQMCHSPSNTVLLDRHHVVQIDGARLLQPLPEADEDFRWHAADRGGNRGNCDTGEVSDRTFSRTFGSCPIRRLIRWFPMEPDK
jgi:hypothetical protein